MDRLIMYKGKYQQWTVENSNYDFHWHVLQVRGVGWRFESAIFYDYMLKVIIPNSGEERPVFLLYDGHVTHVDNKVVALAVINDIKRLSDNPRH